MSTTRKTKTAPKPERKAAAKTAGRNRAPAAKKRAAARPVAADQDPAPPGDAEIAALAYQIWEEAGRPDGHSQDHWREAEARLRKSAG